MINLNNFRVVRGEESATSHLISYSDAPFVVEYFDGEQWNAIWGLEEELSVSEAVEELPDEVIQDLQ